MALMIGLACACGALLMLCVLGVLFVYWGLRTLDERLAEAEEACIVLTHGQEQADAERQVLAEKQVDHDRDLTALATRAAVQRYKRGLH